VTDDDRDPSDEERAAMAWWNSLTESQRIALLEAAADVLGRPTSVAEAWNLRLSREITGPPLPRGARPIAVVDTAAGGDDFDGRERPTQPQPLRTVDPKRKADLAARARAEMEAFRQRGAQRAAMIAERWGTGGADGMTRLARGFPMLAEARGIDPWDVGTFLRWACTADLTSSSLYAVRFVLQVWNARTDWRAAAADKGLDGAHLEPFNVVDALAAWDDAHRAAFVSWCEAPFWP
jgi:hypothetical protein